MEIEWESNFTKFKVYSTYTVCINIIPGTIELHFSCINFILHILLLLTSELMKKQRMQKERMNVANEHRDKQQVENDNRQRI